MLVVDSLIPEYGGNLFNIHGIENRLQVNISDVRDEHSMRYLVQGQDFLFNLAGQTSHLDSMEDPYTDLEINCRAQLTILEACRKYNPGIKILYNNVYGIRACALRLTNTYGPRMRVRDARQTFLGVWIRLVVEGKPFEVWGGEQRRDFTYVDDAVDACLLAAAGDNANGRVFNIGDGPPVTLRQAAMLLAEIANGTWVRREFPENRKRIDIGDYYSDDRWIRTELGWAPKVELRDGLLSTLEYYRAHLSHYL